jgi:hypothetical protein
MRSARYRIARCSRQWLLWLALVLLAAHSVATWHPYSHSMAQSAGHADKKNPVDLADCGLCLAGTANHGGAPPISGLPLPPQLAPHALLPTRLPSVQLAPARQPYAIRAPPVIAG